MQATKGLKWFM